MLKTNSFSSANQRQSGPKSAKKQPLSVFERKIGTHQAKNTARTERMFLRGNELNKSFEMNGLDFYNAENELIFERKRTPFGLQKWQKAAFARLRIRDRDAINENTPRQREKMSNRGNELNKLC